MTRETGLAAIAFATLVCAPRASEAKCAYQRVEAFPPASTRLPVNGRIVVEGYGEAQSMVKAIATHHPELWAEGDRVSLRVVETNVGDFRLTQAVLVPERPLLPKTRYTLRIYESDLPVSDDSEIKLRDTFAWTTGSGADHGTPHWQAPPQTGKRVYEELGCGPEIYVEVSVSVADPSPFQVRAELRPVGGGPASRYLLQPQHGVIEIGHGMCSGPFELSDGRSYTVTLTAVDVGGNISPAPGPVLQIASPGPKDGAR